MKKAFLTKGFLSHRPPEAVREKVLALFKESFSQS